MRSAYLLSLSVLTALSVNIPSSSADARIRCVEGYQVVNGQPISTPYCQDNYLAKVAREYGSRVSAAEVRSNPNYKRRVCNLVGNDIRVHEACAGTGSRVRGPRGGR